MRSLDPAARERRDKTTGLEVNRLCKANNRHNGSRGTSVDACIYDELRTQKLTR